MSRSLFPAALCAALALASLAGCASSGTYPYEPKSPEAILLGTLAFQGKNIHDPYVDANVLQMKGIMIEISPLDGGTPLMAKSDSQGRFHFSGLKPGTYRVSRLIATVSDAHGAWWSDTFPVNSRFEIGGPGVYNAGGSLWTCLGTGAHLVQNRIDSSMAPGTYEGRFHDEYPKSALLSLPWRPIQLF